MLQHNITQRADPHRTWVIINNPVTANHNVVKFISPGQSAAPPWVDVPIGPTGTLKGFHNAPHLGLWCSRGWLFGAEGERMGVVSFLETWRPLEHCWANRVASLDGQGIQKGKSIYGSKRIRPSAVGSHGSGPIKIPRACKPCLCFDISSNILLHNVRREPGATRPSFAR